MVSQAKTGQCDREQPGPWNQVVTQINSVFTFTQRFQPQIHSLMLSGAENAALALLQTTPCPEELVIPDPTAAG